MTGVDVSPPLRCREAGAFSCVAPFQPTRHDKSGRVMPKSMYVHMCAILPMIRTLRVQLVPVPSTSRTVSAFERARGREKRGTDYFARESKEMERQVDKERVCVQRCKGLGLLPLQCDPFGVSHASARHEKAGQQASRKRKKENRDSTSVPGVSVGRNVVHTARHGRNT